MARGGRATGEVQHQGGARELDSRKGPAGVGWQGVQGEGGRERERRGAAKRTRAARLRGEKLGRARWVCSQEWGGSGGQRAGCGWHERARLSAHNELPLPLPTVVPLLSAVQLAKQPRPQQIDPMYSSEQCKSGNSPEQACVPKRREGDEQPPLNAVGVCAAPSGSR